jgi:DNA (cytosine-5)-methyltransferase 1
VGSRTGVRRLTPLECERLQGFPDFWTLYDADGNEQSDAARYRRLGNAVAVPVVEWIARRIVAADSLLAVDATPAEDGGEAA